MDITTILVCVWVELARWRDRQPLTAVKRLKSPVEGSSRSQEAAINLFVNGGWSYVLYPRRHIVQVNSRQ
jgi:hypothetical protein